MGIGVAEFYSVTQLVSGECRVVHIEIKQSYRIDMVKVEIPVGPLHALLTDWKSGIEQRAVLKELLKRILHFNDKLLAIFGLAIHVENRLALRVNVSEMLGVEILHIGDDMRTLKQRV